jgi:hypothetical protein
MISWAQREVCNTKTGDAPRRTGSREGFRIRFRATSQQRKASSRFTFRCAEWRRCRTLRQKSHPSHKVATDPIQSIRHAFDSHVDATNHAIDSVANTPGLPLASLLHLTREQGRECLTKARREHEMCPLRRGAEQILSQYPQRERQSDAS